MKSKLSKIIILAVLLLLPIFVLKAAESENKGTIFVASDETITGNLLAAGESVIIDGVISGDLIAAANSIAVTGRIEGDIIGLAQDISIEGEVGGNIRVVGNSVFINSAISRNLNAFGSKVVIGKDARIGWDAIIGSLDSTIRGYIDGHLDSYSQKTFISGKVGKNANLRIYNKALGEGLILDKETIINGDLNYSAKNKIDLNNEAVVSGEINFKTLEKKERDSASTWLWGRLFAFLSIIFIGLIFVFIIPRYSRRFISQAKTKTGFSFLWGAAAVLIIPPLSLIIAFTIIGLPLALILISLWLAGIFIGKTMAALILGTIIVKEIFKKEQIHLFWPLLFGAIILSLLFSIPWLGWMINLTAIWLGWGSILLYIANKPKNI
jgi:cytoskeletal protein CcmA (bactofilin family)